MVVASVISVQSVKTEIRVDSGFIIIDPYLTDFCNAIDTTGKTWTGATQAGGPHAISEALKARSERTLITADRVLTELGKIGFANMADYMKTGPDGDPYLDYSALTRDQAAALQEVTVENFKDGRGEKSRDVRRVKFKLADKRAALVDLGRHLGMFVDKHEVAGKDGGPVKFESSVNMTEVAKLLLIKLAETSG